MLIKAERQRDRHYVDPFAAIGAFGDLSISADGASRRRRPQRRSAAHRPLDHQQAVRGRGRQRQSQAGQRLLTSKARRSRSPACTLPGSPLRARPTSRSRGRHDRRTGRRRAAPGWCAGLDPRRLRRRRGSDRQRQRRQCTPAATSTSRPADHRHCGQLLRRGRRRAISPASPGAAPGSTRRIRWMSPRSPRPAATWTSPWPRQRGRAATYRHRSDPGPQRHGHDHLAADIVDRDEDAAADIEAISVDLESHAGAIGTSPILDIDTSFASDGTVNALAALACT